MLTARPQIPPLGEIGAVPFNAAIKEEKKRKKRKKNPPCYAKYYRNLFSITVVTGHFALHW